jgi:hypothetical protein
VSDGDTSRHTCGKLAKHPAGRRAMQIELVWPLCILCAAIQRRYDKRLISHAESNMREKAGIQDGVNCL